MKTIAKSEAQKKQAAVLSEYADLRAGLTDLQIKALKEDTTQYDSQIGEIVNKINKILALPEEK
ncbi:MAG TPA: hypothetical protein VI461_08390 [Chitinophagaceae bacterium]|nr:hypothetical protein [Chitinophagaceae bacterium]